MTLDLPDLNMALLKRRGKPPPSEPASGSTTAPASTLDGGETEAAEEAEPEVQLPRNGLDDSEDDDDEPIAKRPREEPLDVD